MLSKLLFNRDKISTVFKENFNDVYRFVFSKTYNRDVTEDIVSDTFFTYFGVSEKHDEKRSKIKTFLFGIALNKLRQTWNKQRSIKELSLDEEIHTENVLMPSKKRKELFKKVTKSLELLPEKYKVVIKLRFLEYKSIEEVSKELNLTKTNVTTIQNRGLEKIRKIINEEQSK